MSEIQVIHRRGFLGGLFSAGAFVLGVSPVAAGRAALAQAAPGDGTVDGAHWHPSVYVGLETNGQVIIVTHRSEMGTGIRTSLPMVLADELEADWNRVKIQQAIGDKRYGSQNTDGSSSIVDFYDAFRQAGATARLMLERAAAAQWGVPAAECRAQNHRVVHQPSRRAAGFGELVAAASRLPVPPRQELRLKSPDEFRYIGKGVPMADQHAMGAGRAVFGADVRLPGMVFASIEHPPVYGGRLKSVDATEARKSPGVLAVEVIDPPKGPIVFQPLGGVAVIGDNTWTVLNARRLLKLEWEDGPNASYNSATFKQTLLETAHKPQKVVRRVGNVDAEFAKGGKTHEADYYTPLLAHAAMEPPTAVALYRDGKVETWAPTQNPQAVQDAVGSALGIDPKNVTCHVTLLGGGFGRKSKPDYVVEAALLSRKVGRPVQVVWSREDDIRHDYYHTVAAVHMKAVTDARGKPTALLQRTVFPTIASTFDPSAQYGANFEMSHGWVDMPFDIPNIQAENGPAKNPIRIGWLRSVANIYHAFAIQSFLDELAAAAGRDRIEYFLDVLGQPRKIDYKAEGTDNFNYGRTLEAHPVDTGRLRRVVEVVAEKSGWNKKRVPVKGQGMGFAAHRSFLSYVAVVVDLTVDRQGQARIRRIDLAVDAGQIIHPDRVVAQFEGAAVFGTSIALFGEINVRNGKVRESNFHDYQVARMSNAPYEIHVHLVPSTHSPGGVGEPGVPPVVPAITNAIFAATGKRIRSLPVSGTVLV